MRSRIAAMICAAALAPTASADDRPYPNGLVGAKRTKVINEMRQLVRESLKDPESARFEQLGLFRGEDESSYSLCGLVNAKNSYGGYSGNTRFILTNGGNLWIETSEPRGAMSAMWPVWCAKPL